MAHFYTGQLRLARLCVLRSLMKRPSVLFLRRAAPYKGFALALLRIYPCAPMKEIRLQLFGFLSWVSSFLRHISVDAAWNLSYNIHEFFVKYVFAVTF